MTSITPGEQQSALSEELSSLRDALNHYQHTAHASALQLQRQTLETAFALEKATQLEQQNAYFQKELAVLRAHSDTTPHPATLAASELTVAHRRLSDRLTLTEESLLDCTRKLNHALADINTMSHYATGTKQAVERARRREEEARERSRLLENTVRALTEQKNMAEHALQEYADLVLGMEGRARKSLVQTPSPSSDSSHASTPNPMTVYRASNQGVQKMLEDFNSKSASMEQEMSRLHGELEDALSLLDIEKKDSEEGRNTLSQLQHELESYKNDDRSAAKQVSRYMKFSQTSIDLLQSALEAQKARHEATVGTLEAQKDDLARSLLACRTQNTHFRAALDDLTEDVSRETYGRRREVSLRLRLISREERITEQLRVLVSILRDACERQSSPQPPDDSPNGSATPPVDAMQRAFGKASQLLLSVEGNMGEHPIQTTPASEWSMGAIARVVAAEDAVNALVDELHAETDRRLKLEAKIGDVIGGNQEEPVVENEAVPASGDGSKETLVELESSVVYSNSSAIEDSPPATPKAYPTPLVPTFDIVPIESQDDIAPEGQQQPQQPPTPTEPTENVSPSSPRVVITEAPDPTPTPLELGSQSLLSRLTQAATRYDAISKSFKDCHLTLSRLKDDLIPSQSTLANGNPASKAPDQDNALLGSFLSRLNDYSEDCRVELEIRIADEIRIAKGYETLLTVPGAIADEKAFEDVERRVISFVEGTDSSTTRALESFNRKLGDLEHDIALLKQAAHEVEPLDVTPPEEEPLKEGVSKEESLNSPDTGTAPSQWSWTSSLLPSASSLTRSRPSSPAPSFGSLMTEKAHNGGSQPLHKASHLAGLPFKIAMPLPVPAPPQFPPTRTSPKARYPTLRQSFSNPTLQRPNMVSSSTGLAPGLNFQFPGTASPLRRPSWVGQKPRTVSSGSQQADSKLEIGSQLMVATETKGEVSESEAETDTETETDLGISDVE